VYFFSTESVSEGLLSQRYAVHAWDMDDAFTDCHHSGEFALPDPNGLVYCAEGDLEKRLLADEAGYARYVDVLEDLLDERLTPAVFDAAMDRTAAELLPFFDRPEICAAMVELLGVVPGATDPVVARAAVLERVANYKALFRTRSEALKAAVEAYRAAEGGP